MKELIYLFLLSFTSVYFYKKGSRDTIELVEGYFNPIHVDAFKKYYKHRENKYKTKQGKNIKV